MNASIDFIEGRYFAAVWFVAGGSKDLLAAVYKDAGKPWTLIYRFRYYAGPDAFDGKDTKNWYSGTMPAETPEAEVTKGFDYIAQMTEIHYKGKMTKLVMQSSDAKKNIEMMTSQDWCHAQELSKGFESSN